MVTKARPRSGDGGGSGSVAAEAAVVRRARRDGKCFISPNLTPVRESLMRLP
jgi:hypothetical protein